MPSKLLVNNGQPVSEYDAILNEMSEIKFNDGGDGGMSLEARVAKLESDVNHIMLDIGEIKTDIRSMDNNFKAEIRRLDDKADSNFKWLIGIFLTAFLSAFGGLAFMMAHGFHWL